MIRNLRFLALFILFLPLSLLAQNGKLSGVVSDRATKEPVPFAAVRVMSGGQLKGGGVANENGEYVVSPLTPGVYDVEYSALGFRKVLIKEVRINFETTTRLAAALPSEAQELQEVVVEAYKVPLIDKDNTSTGTKLTGKDIEKLPSRNINAVLTTTAGVFSNDDGGALNVRGNRGGDNIVYVNGVRQYGTLYPPVETIAEISVITGGVPAQYGDALGGIISVTTKGAAEKYRAGAQYETSSLFDKYNYNLVGANVSGPILRRTTIDPITNKESRRTILGGYAAYTYQYEADSKPSAYGYLVVNDSTLQGISQTPFRRLTDETGKPNYRSQIDFLGPNNFNRVQARPNSASSQNQFNITLDYQPADNIVISVGGNYNKGSARNISYLNLNTSSANFNLFNAANNNSGSQTDYNAFIRFRQTFPDLGKDGGSGIKNFYYQIQADYSRVFNITQDPTYKEHQELYYYWGKYKDQRRSLGGDTLQNFYIYQPGTSTIVDSINTRSTNGTEYRILGNTITQGLSGPIVFDPYAGAGAYTNINKQIIADEAGTGYVKSLSDLLQYGGLLNGLPSSIIAGYSSPINQGGFSYPGQLQSNYGWQSNEQYRFSGQVAGDLGRHSIKVGFEYEQRVNRSYGGAFSPWLAARRLLNNQIVSTLGRGTSLSNFTTTFENGHRVITIDPDLSVNTDGEGNVLNQSAYDKRIRQILGVPVNKLINADELDPSLVNVKNFTADELLGDGFNSTTGYQGVSTYGDVQKGRPSFFDFFSDTVNRPIDAFRPIYYAGFIEDKFEINDLIIRAGLRVDQFDVNQPVLKDNYSLTRLTRVGEVDLSKFKNSDGTPYQVPSSVGSDYAIYVNQTANTFTPSSASASGNEGDFVVNGFRNGSQYYDRFGREVTDYRQVAQEGVIYPLYDVSKLNAADSRIFKARGITKDAFQDFKPQTNLMPRLAFSFPISEDALFFAHYDVLTQRPLSNSGNTRSGPNTFDNFGSPLQYYNLSRISGNPFITNPALLPQKKIDYQIGFQQRLSQNSALKLSAFYTEIKDLIQIVNVLGGYPNPGYQTNGNIDFGIVKGTTLSYDFRKRGGTGFGANASYTLQFAEGSASDFAAALLNTSTPNLRNIAPQNWDQRHALKLNLDYRTDDRKGPRIFGTYPFENAGFNATTYLGSGQPYTKDGSPWGGRSQVEGSINGARLPWTNRTGMRVDKSFYFKGKNSSGESSLNVYVYVQNVFNQLNTLDVYRRTGRPDDDGYLSSQFGQSQISQGNIANYSAATYIYYYQQQLLNPNYVSLPRRWRIGVSYSF